MQQTYICPNCSAPVAYGEMFCRYCGTNFNWEVPQTPPPSPPQSYDYQQSNPQQTWGQQWPPGQAGWGQPPGWNQQPPYNQSTGWENPTQYQQQYAYGYPPAVTKKKMPLSPIGLVIVAIAILAVVGGIAFALSGSPSAKPPSSTSSTQPPASTPSAPTEKPPAITFSINPGTITKGQKANLSWNVTGATAVSIDQSIGAVSASGTKEVSPTVTTTYVLTATNNTGYMSASTTVAVTTPVVPVITSFTTTPATISAGQSTTLQWSVAGATSILIDQGIGVSSAAWSQVVSPAKTTTYNLTATNREGSVTASVTVTVGAAGAPLITSFTATPNSISAGQSAILQWDVTGATSVSINQDVGTVISSGTKEVSPTATTTYTLTARNNTGSVTASATVTVGAATVPVISFSNNPITINPGQSSTLQWNVTGATSISIDQGIGTVSATGTQTVSPSTTTTYTLTATNSFGTATRSTTVTVAAATAPVINSFTATPSTISAGQSATLQWSITGADSISIDQGIGTLPPSTSYVVSPTTTTTYTLTATNSVGSVTRPVTVTVP